MKVQMIVALTLIVFSQVSQAGCTPWGCSCAPEVRQQNVQATEAALKGLAQNELHDQVKFRNLVNSSIASTLSPDQKIDAFLRIAGVTNDEQLVQLISSREFSAEQVSSVAKTTDLSHAQAKLVLERVQSAVIGERQ